MQLDCESLESTLESLKNLFSCQKQDLEDLLLSLDIDGIYKEHWESITIPSEDYLYKFCLDNLGAHDTLSSVCWFHLTRTTEENLFENGILPLGCVLDNLWAMLVSKAPSKEVKDNLLKIKSKNNSYLYTLKAPDEAHWGPYAILVRAVAFNAESLFQHNYLRMPEIIEDICLEYEETYKLDLLSHYNSNLIPKIVKFRSNNRLDDGCIKAALFYAYTGIRNQLPCANAVTCFDSEGIAVPAEDILNIENVDLANPSTP